MPLPEGSPRCNSCDWLIDGQCISDPVSLLIPDPSVHSCGRHPNWSGFRAKHGHLVASNPNYPYDCPCVRVGEDKDKARSPLPPNARGHATTALKKCDACRATGKLIHK